MNILNEKPYIQKLIAVVKNSMQRKPRRISVNGRLSDAFVYIISGECDYFFENGFTFTAQAGNVIYLSKHAVYEMKLQSENYSFIYVDFMFEENGQFESALFKNEYDYSVLFRRLYAEYKNASAEHKINCMQRLYDIYAAICYQNKQAAYVPTSLKGRMETCKEYMDAHYDDVGLSIVCLSELAQMSDVYFRKNFQSIYHLSPKKYLTQIRLEHATELMQYSFLTLEECAFACGFSSWQYFSRVFKNAYGETPAVYRKKRSK